MAAHTSESALDGQRRQVTVLFADMAQYTPTAEKLGEEATFTLMHRLIEQISEAVHGPRGRSRTSLATV
jgi:class 3 adenylate cyclase